MLASGLGLEEDTFVEAGRYGSHLLAPTATDLRKYGKKGTYVVHVIIRLFSLTNGTLVYLLDFIRI
jgi:hypothetical protein